MKKILILGLCLILLTGCQSKLKEENKTYKNKIEELEKENQTYKSKIEELEPQLNPTEEILDCKTTMTFRVSKILNDYEYVDSGIRTYIVVNIFQDYPFLAPIPIEMIDKIKENQTYEFTFSGTEFIDNHREVFYKYKIEKIENTDKLGLEQVNKAIKCETK